MKSPTKVMDGLTSRVARRLEPARPSRRGFLGGATLVGAALAADPLGYLTRPASAYDAVCGSDNTCSAGYSVFCCTINGGQNACPPDSFVGGWWKADNSSFCGGSARYYIDCNAYRDNHYTCHCNSTTCDQRLVACNQFRYGQCNTQIPYSATGPVVCRMVSCTPPWEQFAGVCGTTSATDNNTATHSAPCLATTTEPAPPPPSGSGPRIGIVRSDGNLLLKQGGLDAYWYLIGNGVRAAALAGDRIAMLTGDGTVWAKAGDLTAGWTRQAGAGTALALTPTRLGFLEADRWLFVKDGSLAAGWAREAAAVSRLALDGDRIAVVDTAGRMSVKEGGLGAGWQFQSDRTADVALTGTRIGILTQDGTVWVKDGGLQAAWTNLMTGCTGLALAGTRVAVRRANGDLLVKEGGLGAGWVRVADQVSAFALSATRIAAVRGGRLYVKEGATDALWTTEADSVVSVVLN